MRRALLLCFSLASVAMACSKSSASSSSGAPPGADGGGSLDTASAKFPDIHTLWTSSVSRTCGPNNGVCHDNKQFPDMQTAPGLIGAVNQRCNQLRADPTTIDNLCEPSGDTLTFGAFQTHVGNVTPQPDAMSPTTIDVTLQDPLPAGTTTAMVALVRQRDMLPAVTMPIPAAAVTLGSDPHVVTFDLPTLAMSDGLSSGATLADFFLPAMWLAGADDQIELGDPNGDGLFGATLGGALVKPGKPLLSYLFLRINAPLVTGPMHPETNVQTSAVVEQQMPIANFQYWDATNAGLALWCWISTMKDDASNADDPIDYTHCDTSGLTPVTLQTGEAVTYTHIYEQILSPSCAVPCHFPGTKQATTFYLDDPDTAYETLLGLHGSGPTESMLPFVTRNDPTNSYLYLKVSEKTPPVGGQMPLSAPLPDATVAAIQTWIAQGANQD